LFEWLGIESENKSKTSGEDSFDRDEIERINKSTEDPLIKEFTQCFIDNSFAAIIRNNFIKAFYTYTVNSRLQGNFKLLGALSGRYTSSKPNLLQLPSTGSIFAKPVKECFTAPEGKLILAVDLSALT
jgi:DNA polymerase-1